MFSNKKIKVCSDNDSANEVDFLSALNNSYNWKEHEAEGELSVDVAQTETEIIVVAPMAGTPADKIDLHLHNDLLTIRGNRICPIESDLEYHHQETYWGRFSRSIILPVEVSCELVSAQYRNGILVIRLPKRKIDQKIRIMVVDE